jgi:hypothetical protein
VALRPLLFDPLGHVFGAGQFRMILYTPGPSRCFDGFQETETMQFSRQGLRDEVRTLAGRDLGSEFIEKFLGYRSAETRLGL